LTGYPTKEGDGGEKNIQEEDYEEDQDQLVAEDGIATFGKKAR
jgi:hypothetical protein